MKVSKEILELAEKIKDYRTDIKLIKELNIKKEALEKQVEELEKSIKILKLNTIEQNKLLEQIKELEINKKKLKLDLEKSKEAYTFVVTTPSEASNTVYGEISRELSKAQQEILISSPWITHIVDELSSFKKKGNKKGPCIKIITRFLKEDIGVVTPYVKQKVQIEEFLKDIKIRNVEVDTVHKFQGREKDIIIISFARSKKYSFPKYKLRFIENETLVNVAITRAKKKLILVGNSGTLCQSKLLKNVIDKIGNTNSIIL